jgi:hypothetical protein
MPLRTQNTVFVLSALGSPGPVCVPPPPGLGVGGWCWLGYRLPIGWCYWDYPIAPISPYHVVGLLAHIPTGAPPAGPWQELVWQFALERLVGSGSTWLTITLAGYWLVPVADPALWQWQVTCLTRCPRSDTEHAANVRLLRSAMLVG